MKILLIAGHGAGDTGANGCGYQEYKLTRELVDLIAPRLRKYVTVDIYDKSHSAFYDCQNGTFVISNYDYVLEVHFNACVNDQKGDGHTTGTEIYVTSSEKATTVEQGIINRVSACGLTNRGVKVCDFLVIKTIKNKGISSALIETCFIDDKDDMTVYNKKKTMIADAIVDGIIEGFNIKKNLDNYVCTVEYENVNGNKKYINVYTDDDLIYTGKQGRYNWILKIGSPSRNVCNKIANGRASEKHDTKQKGDEILCRKV